MKVHKTITITLYAIIGTPITLLLLYFGFVGFMTLRYPAPSCDNTNPVFENNPFDSKVYKTELIRLLKETRDEKTRFWFSKYIDPNHIAVTIQNERICAKGYLTVHKWEGFMKHLKEVEGRSYRGRLLGLKYSMIDDRNNPEIILLSVREIVD